MASLSGRPTALRNQATVMNLISSCCLFYGRAQPASPPVAAAPPTPAVADKHDFRPLFRNVSSSALTEFTIHGLWPDKNDGTWSACCPGKRFDIREISKLLSIMNKYWPSYSCESASNCHGGTGIFWEHEWEKHGPCSFPVVRDEYDYFETALNLYFKHNVMEVLREAGYVASNYEKYPLGGIDSAIENAFSATPALICSGDAVEELRLCFYKDFKFRDCAVESSEDLCPSYVSLPMFLPSDLASKEAGPLQSTLK